tara:strand:+ start:1521 stop:3746 length:2226 start_codon:yes stop_codon:yes gene_type:complete
MKKYLIIIILISSIFGQSFKDLTERPTYNPIKIDEPILFDGIVDNQEWSRAQVATNFNGSGTFQGQPSDLRTEARLFYDDENIYVGFKAFVEREDLRYTITKRDNLDDKDDRVWINIDAFDDESLTYGIGVSAGGAQIDGRATYGFDQSLDLIYESKVSIFEDRYEVELVIPFSSLRYSVAPVQTWRVDFGRGFTLADELTRYVYWTSRMEGIECQTCQLGFLNNIEPPRQKRGDIEFIPSVVAGSSKDFSDNTSSSSDEASLFMKYPISSVDLLEIALNPDFSQIESDDIKNDVNTVNALYFEEKRPFFSQGAELFQFSAQRGYINLFYSRTINDPSLAAKYTGKLGKTSYGIISARDESSLLLLPFEETSTVVTMGKSTSNIIRAKRMIGGNGGSIGAILTNRVFDNAGDMTTGGLDFHYHPGDNYHLTLHATASIHNESDNFEYVYEPTDSDSEMTFDSGRYTKNFDGEKVTGNALGFSVNRRDRTDNFGLVLRLRSPGFRTSNGFETNNATKWLKVNRGKTVYYDEHPTLLKTDYGISTIYKTNYTGVIKKQEFSLSTDSDLKNGDFFKVSAEFETENFRGYQFDNLYEFEFGYRNQLNSDLKLYNEIQSRNIIVRNLDIPQKSDYYQVKSYVEYRVSDKSNFGVGISYQKAEDYYDGIMLRASINNSFNSKLTMRTKIQYNDFSNSWFIEPIITYQPNAFSALYFGVNDLLQTEDNIISSLTESKRQIFIKFQYLF